MRYKFLGVFAALTVVSACGDVTSINQNPNGPTDVPPPSILPNVIQTLVGTVDGVTSLNVRGPGLWVQYYSQIQYRDEDKFLLRSGTSGGWGLYNGALEDIQRMIVKGQTSNTPNWSATGRILKSYTFSVMTEAMGDLPYTDALKGDTLLHPTYDTQQSIYDSLFANLVQANTEIDTTTGVVGFSSGDLMYDGDMAKWKRFGNSLRLRLAVHISNADPTKAASEAAAAVAAGVFTSNADNAQLLYLAGAPNQNPIYQDVWVGKRDDYGMSKTLVDSLTSWADPRLPIFAQLPPGGGAAYNGLPNGLKDGQGTGSLYPLASISRFGAMWRETPNAPMALMTYSEVLFLEAEAAERGWIPGGTAQAAIYYNNAITASMLQFGLTLADANTYEAQAKVLYDAAGATLQGHLQQIAYQKWTSLFMQGMEAWTELRRTQVPKIVPGCFADFRHTPERLPYDDNEAVLNAANLDAAVGRQGLTQGNDISTKPLWFTGRATSTDYPPLTSPAYCP